MIGQLHDSKGQLSRMFDVSDRCNTSGSMFRTVHHCRVQFHDTIFVRYPAIANRRVSLVRLNDPNAFDFTL